MPSGNEIFSPNPAVKALPPVAGTPLKRRPLPLRYPGERPFAGRHGYSHGPGLRQYTGSIGVRERSPRAEAYGLAGRDREIGPLPCIRCIELHHRLGTPCRRWSLHQSNLNMRGHYVHGKPECQIMTA